MALFTCGVVRICTRIRCLDHVTCLVFARNVAALTTTEPEPSVNDFKTSLGLKGSFGSEKDERTLKRNLAMIEGRELELFWTKFVQGGAVGFQKNES